MYFFYRVVKLAIQLILLLPLFPIQVSPLKLLQELHSLPLLSPQLLSQLQLLWLQLAILEHIQLQDNSHSLLKYLMANLPLTLVITMQQHMVLNSNSQLQHLNKSCINGKLLISANDCCSIYMIFSVVHIELVLFKIPYF